MIYIVPDSNFLHISFDKSRTITYSHFGFNQPFDELISLRDLDTCNDMIQILMSEIVLRDLVKRYQISEYCTRLR